jgi:Domain of unknown function (DUF4350)
MTTVTAPAEAPVLRHPAVRWGVAFVALIAGLALLATLLDELLPAPSGPASSSYATTTRGLAAYAELLSRLGHPVSRLRVAPSDTTLDPSSTLVLLDPGAEVAPADIAALRSFVSSGGRLIAGGEDSEGLASALAGARVAWEPVGPRVVRAVGVAGARKVVTSGDGSYRCPGGRRFVLVCVAGGGRVRLLADSSPLTNARLVQADNAVFGAALVGRSARPVVFAETVHGFSAATGLAALPAAGWWAVALLLLAGIVYLVARWPRLGPAVEPDEVAAPPRREHVEALAGALASTRDRRPAAARLRAASRAIVTRRAGLEPDASGERLARAGAALGLASGDVVLLTGDGARDEDLVALGGLLAHLRSEEP